MKLSKKASEKSTTAKIKKYVAPKQKVSSGEDVHKLVHLLQVNQIELEHQNQELRIAEQELEASRAKYVNLFDFSPIPYFTLDKDGMMKEVNLSAANMFGTDRSKLIGKSFASYIPLEEKNMFSAFINAVCTASVKQSFKARVVNKEKKMFHVLLEGVKLVDLMESDQQCQIALIDLTGYKKLEDSYTAISKELQDLKKVKR